MGIKPDESPRMSTSVLPFLGIVSHTSLLQGEYFHNVILVKIRTHLSRKNGAAIGGGFSWVCSRFWMGLHFTWKGRFAVWGYFFIEDQIKGCLLPALASMLTVSLYKMLVLTFSTLSNWGCLLSPSMPCHLGFCFKCLRNLTTIQRGFFSRNTSSLECLLFADLLTQGNVSLSTITLPNFILTFFLIAGILFYDLCFGYLLNRSGSYRTGGL